LWIPLSPETVTAARRALDDNLLTLHQFWGWGNQEFRRITYDYRGIYTAGQVDHEKWHRLASTALDLDGACDAVLDQLN
jgi:hypothetical protein